MKNEHIVYAYCTLFDGDKCLLLIGITDVGWGYLGAEGGNFLMANPPPGRQFANVKDVWIVRGKDKKEILEMLQTIGRQKGVKIEEAH